MWAILILQPRASPCPASPPRIQSCFEFFPSVLECQRPNQCRNFLWLVFTSSCCWHHRMFRLLFRSCLQDGIPSEIQYEPAGVRQATNRRYQRSKTPRSLTSQESQISSSCSPGTNTTMTDFSLIASAALIPYPSSGGRQRTCVLSPFHWGQCEGWSCQKKKTSSGSWPGIKRKYTVTGHFMRNTTPVNLCYKNSLCGMGYNSGLF